MILRNMNLKTMIDNEKSYIEKVLVVFVNHVKNIPVFHDFLSSRFLVDRGLINHTVLYHFI